LDRAFRQRRVIDPGNSIAASGIKNIQPNAGMASALQTNKSVRRKADSMSIRILVVDDHDLVRQGLRMFLGLDPDFEIVAEAADGAEALLKARQCQPDAGQVQLSPKAAERLMQEVRAPESPEALTARETEVLRLIAQGMANKEIASALNIGEKTVKTHVGNILTKLEVPSRTQAALYAARIGLVNLK
jgi:DNA-binding NarL/FixJ family response regulator